MKAVTGELPVQRGTSWRATASCRSGGAAAAIGRPDVEKAVAALSRRLTDGAGVEIVRVVVDRLLWRDQRR